MKKKIGVILLLSGVATMNFAQVDMSKLKITGQIRPRAELYNGTNGSLANARNVPGLAIQQRSRLNFQYTDEKLTVKIAPQYINFWGEDPQTFDLTTSGTQDGTVTIAEAWALYKASEKISFKFGRQAISYGDQRVLGGLDWAAAGRFHDALVIKYASGSTKLDFGVTYNDTEHNNNVTTYTPPASGQNKAHIGTGPKSMQYLWLSQKLGDLSLGATAINLVIEETSGSNTIPVDLFTFGLLPKYKLSDAFTISASGYYQTGIGLGEDNAVSAYLANLDLIYKADGKGVTLGTDIVSGDANTTNNTSTSFNPLFGTHHKFYGLMDYFYVGENSGNEVGGLIDVYLKTSMKASDKLTLVAHGHYFMSESGFDGAEEYGTGEGLGFEADLILKYKVTKGFGLVAGYSQMFASEALDDAIGGSASEFNQWSWVQANVTF